MTLEWMAWTWPTAAFFASVALMLTVMTGLQLVWPTVERRGFMPIRTTRGDRLFVGLLGSAYIHLFWLALIDAPLWGASIMAVIWMALVLRWG
jgi:predicted small integral membrane protein